METKTAMKTIKKTKVEVVNPKTVKGKTVKSLSLDEIENEMTAIAMDDTQDFLKMMVNEKRLGMLEKVANFKLHRLQVKALEQNEEPIEDQPLEVIFISSKTNEQMERLDRIENQVRDGRTVKQDA